VQTRPTTQAVKATEELIERYGKLIFHVIYGLTGHWQESEDLTQEVFLQALRGIDDARASRGEHFSRQSLVATNCREYGA